MKTTRTRITRSEEGLGERFLFSRDSNMFKYGRIFANPSCIEPPKIIGNDVLKFALGGCIFSDCLKNTLGRHAIANHTVSLVHRPKDAAIADRRRSGPDINPPF